MKILHIIASIDPMDGGPIEGVTQQARHRLGNGSTTAVASLDPPGKLTAPSHSFDYIALGRKQAPANARHSLLPWVRYRYSSKMIPWLKGHVGDYDVVVVNGLWNFAAFAAQAALAGGQTPYVVFTHGMLDPWFKKTYPLKSLLKQVSWWFCEGPLLKNAAAVFFTTEEEKILACQSFRPYRVHEQVVGYGTSDISGDAETQIAAFRSRLPALTNRRFLLFLSRIHPKKGCDLLIDAFARLATAYPDLDLVLAGPDQTGWGKDLKVQADRLGIADRIHWPGMLSGDLKWGAFRAAEAFVLPSHQENFGIVVAEAMAAGKPVLITDKVNIWREIKATGSGLVEADTVEGIHRLLDAYFLLSAEERNAMGKQARATFLELYEMKTAMTSIETCLREIIDHDRAP